jgi:hypothetical protein
MPNSLSAFPEMPTDLQSADESNPLPSMTEMPLDNDQDKGELE